jgi:hypothetical protein
MSKLKEIIRKKLKEMSATGQGGASFTAGQGEGYATPAAFASKTNSKGTKNIYYYKLGFKPVPDKIKGSGLQVKKLWEEDILNEVNEFQQKRLDALEEIEKLMNEIGPLLSNAKNQTVEYYQANPGQFSIYKPTSMALEYIKKAKELLSK